MDKGRDYPKINAKKDIRIRPKSQANFRHRADPKVAECNGAPRDGCAKGYAIWRGDPGSGRPAAPAKRSACAVITVPCPHRAPWCAAAVPHRRAQLRQGAMLGGAPRWGAGGTGRRALRGYWGRTETPPAKLSACATCRAPFRGARLGIPCHRTWSKRRHNARVVRPRIILRRDGDIAPYRHNAREIRTPLRAASRGAVQLLIQKGLTLF